MPDGSVRRFEQSSNRTPFSVTPRIDTLGTPDGTGVLTVTGYVFQHADLDPEDVEVYLGSQRLVLKTSTGGKWWLSMSQSRHTWTSTHPYPIAWNTAD